MALAAAQPSAVPPGPKGVPFWGSLLAFHRDPLAFLCELEAHYGPVCQVRFGPEIINVLSTPALIERLLVDENQRCIKDRPTQELVPLVGRGLLTSEGEEWKRQRRLAAPAFQPKRIATYADTMVTCARQAFCEYQDGELRNFHADIMALTLEVVSKTLFSVSTRQEARRIAQALDASIPYFEDRIFSWRGLLPAWLPTRRARDFHAAVKVLDDVIANMITAIRQHGERDDSLIGRLIQARDEDGSGLGEQELRDQAITLLLAGHETTALTIMFAVYLLCTHPESNQSLQAELDREVGARAIRFEDLARLPFLDAVIKETLRLYPSAPILGREVVTAFELQGHVMEKGCQILLSPYAIQRSARYFSTPERFQPERWLDGLARRLPRFAYFPFGGGARVCIGNHFAAMEAQLLLASLIQQVTLEVPHDFHMEPVAVVTLRSRYGLPARVFRRA